jgi:hypothetical protein
MPAASASFLRAGKFIYALQCCDRAGDVGRATQGHQRSVVESFDPAAPIVCLVAAKVAPGDLRATQTAGKAEQLHHGPVAKPAQRTAGTRGHNFGEFEFILMSSKIDLRLELQACKMNCVDPLDWFSHILTRIPQG